MPSFPPSTGIFFRTSSGTTSEKNSKTFGSIGCCRLSLLIPSTYNSGKCVHSYSLTDTELFLQSLLGEEPVKTVVAPETARSNHVRAASKEREMVFAIVVQKYLLRLK